MPASLMRLTLVTAAVLALTIATTNGLPAAHAQSETSGTSAPAPAAPAAHEIAARLATNCGDKLLLL